MSRVVLVADVNIFHLHSIYVVSRMVEKSLWPSHFPTLMLIEAVFQKSYLSNSTCVVNPCFNVHVFILLKMSIALLLLEGDYQPRNVQFAYRNIFMHFLFFTSMWFLWIVIEDINVFKYGPSEFTFWIANTVDGDSISTHFKSMFWWNKYNHFFYLSHQKLLLNAYFLPALFWVPGSKEYWTDGVFHGL